MLLVGRFTAAKLLPPLVEMRIGPPPDAITAPGTASMSFSAAAGTAEPGTGRKVAPPSVDRRRPRGPTSRTRFASSASSAICCVGVPVLRSDQLAPPFAVFSSEPASSSA